MELEHIIDIRLDLRQSLQRAILEEGEGWNSDQVKPPLGRLMVFILDLAGCASGSDGPAGRESILNMLHDRSPVGVFLHFIGKKIEIRIIADVRAIDMQRAKQARVRQDRSVQADINDLLRRKAFSKQISDHLIQNTAFSNAAKTAKDREPSNRMKKHAGGFIVFTPVKGLLQERVHPS